MVHFTIVSLLIIFSLYQICTQDFGPIDADIDVTALYKLEERMLPALDAFISAREDHLKELEYTLSKSASSRVLSREDIGEYLGNPLNQFHVVKRFVDEWGQLDEYLNSDSSTDGKFDFVSQLLLFLKVEGE